MNLPTTYSNNSTCIAPVEEGWNTPTSRKIRPFKKGQPGACGVREDRPAVSQPTGRWGPAALVISECSGLQWGLWPESSHVWCRVVHYSTCSRKNVGEAKSSPPDASKKQPSVRVCTAGMWRAEGCSLPLTPEKLIFVP